MARVRFESTKHHIGGARVRPCQTAEQEGTLTTRISLNKIQRRKGWVLDIPFYSIASVCYENF